MSDRPILFSAPMVCAILREIEQPGTGKIMTRRIIKPRGRHPSLFNGEWTDGYVLDPGNEDWRQKDIPIKLGDRLYVREAWCSDTRNDGIKPSEIATTEPIWFSADGAGFNLTDWSIRSSKNRPGMFLPRWASRITLIVTDVRVQRLQEISEVDAEAEGISPLPAGRYYCGEDDEGPITAKSAITAFGWLWNGINGERPGCHWQDNPWVAAYTFRPILGNIDQVRP